MDFKKFVLPAGAAVVMSASSVLVGCSALTDLRGPSHTGQRCHSRNYSPAEIFKRVSPSIVVVKTNNSQGSGFVVKQDKRYTYILTNSHVVNGEKEVALKWVDGRIEKGDVVGDFGGSELQKDVALLRVDAIRGVPLPLRESTPSVGAEVVVIGAPQGLEFSLSRGVLSQVRSNGDFIQVDAAINPGNSGGPLLDSSGCVLGLVTFKKADSEALNFALGYQPIKHFLDNPAIERSEVKEDVKQALVKIYEPKLHTLPSELAVKMPPGDGWSLYFGTCYSMGKKDKCFNEYDAYNEATFRLLSDGFDGAVSEVKIYWIRYNGRRGAYAHYETAYTSRSFAAGAPRDTLSSWRYKTVVDCDRWLSAHLDEMNLTPIVPNSYGEHAAKEACLKGSEVEVGSGARSRQQSPIGDSNLGKVIDAKTDQVFWKLYPNMRGKKLSSESKFAKEWMRIREGILNDQADEIFWSRHPSLRGKELPAQGPLAQEWLDIRRGIAH